MKKCKVNISSLLFKEKLNIKKEANVIDIQFDPDSQIMTVLFYGINNT